MALGERASRDIIRSGEDFSQVDITFELENDKTIDEIAVIGFMVISIPVNFLVK